MLKAKNISHNFKDRATSVPALNNITFSIDEKDFVSIIGPSGCGKTTLLNIIAGYLQPSSGHIAIQEKRIVHPGRDRIVINQENDLFDWMTVGQNIAFGLRDTAQPIDPFIALANLEQFVSMRPAQLSGGMKKKASLARALAINPQLLLMDEPFGSLDYQTKEYLQVELLNIWASTQKTIILITHDIEEAVFLSNKIMVLSERPATVKRVIEVPFCYPRTIGIKSDQAFIEIKNEIRKLLTPDTPSSSGISA